MFRDHNCYNCNICIRKGVCPLETTMRYYNKVGEETFVKQFVSGTLPQEVVESYEISLLTLLPLPLIDEE